MRHIVAFFAGILFGIGLAFSGMTDTAKIIGFLDIFGQWDGSMLFVMGSALLIVVPSFYYIQRLPKPFLANEFCIPNSKNVDSRLLIGSLIFGVGWGLYGYCPGPAITSLVYLQLDSFMFVLAMFAGMYAANRFLKT